MSRFPSSSVPPRGLPGNTFGGAVFKGRPNLRGIIGAPNHVWYWTAPFLQKKHVPNARVKSPQSFSHPAVERPPRPNTRSWILTVPNVATEQLHCELPTVPVPAGERDPPGLEGASHAHLSPTWSFPTDLTPELHTEIPRAAYLNHHRVL